METRSQYHLAGLQLLSDYPLPGLSPWEKRLSAQARISIAKAHVPQSLAQVRKEFPDGQCSDEEFLLHIAETARILVRAGDEILVEHAPGITDGDVRPFLLGSAMGVLFHQRGIVPLHAATINVAGGCVAFVGASGAGKSTLAGALAERGYQVLSDDVCYLQCGKSGIVEAWPGVRRLRLWKDAMLALSLNSPDAVRELRGYNKFLIPLQKLPDPVRPRALLRVYLLEDSPEEITQIRGAAALETLLHNVYRLEYAEYMGRKPDIFRLCARLAQQIGVFRFARPLRFDRLQSSIDFLAEHLRDSGL